MASNQKTAQHKRPKTTHNCFLACFGFQPKTNNTTTTTSYNKKPKQSGVRKKFFFKLCWPKFKVITIDNNKNKNNKNNNNNKKKKKKKKISFEFDAKTAALEASHNIMLEAATKVHQQFKMLDHHAPKPVTTQQPIVFPEESTHQDNQSRRSRSQSECTKCHTEENVTPNKAAVVKQSLLANKVTKDSLIGASIMVAMLIIMSIWGRLCAILCMCGWLYCIPLIKGDRDVAPSKSNDTDNAKVSLDFNSELYKKKVVLDGLLQRDHQDAVGIS